MKCDVNERPFRIVIHDKAGNKCRFNDEDAAWLLEQLSGVVAPKYEKKVEAKEDVVVEEKPATKKKAAKRGLLGGKKK